MNKNKISEHIFLFCFAWDYKFKKNNVIAKGHTDIKHKKFDNLHAWQNIYLKIDKDETYNEYVYFYKPIRQAIYTFYKAPIIVRNYRYKNLANDSYIKIKIRNKVYNLKMLNISLKLYKTGVGILSLHILNEKYQDINDIKNINEFSKCIYPPTLPIEKAKKEGFIEDIFIKINDSLFIHEDFRHEYHKDELRINKAIMAILGNSFTDLPHKLQKGKILIEPLLGNNMFYICSFKTKSIKQELKVDKISLWQTYYETYNPKLYNELVCLVLMQRSTLLKFSTEISKISTLPKNQIIGSIQKIYEIYIQFINQLYFKEATEDIQGAKIYELLSRDLNIQKELLQLNFEIDEVREYSSLIEQAESKFKMQLLTIVGAALVIPTFATSFFGMNIFKDEIYSWWNNKNVALWINSYVILPIVITIALCTLSKKQSFFNITKNILIIILFIISIFIIIKYGCGL